MAKLKIAVIESPNPMDLFDGRSESDSLVPACKLIGHQSISFLAKSREEFAEVCKYIASADTAHASKYPSAPLFLHLSCHGNGEGVAFGESDVSWELLVQDIEPILSNPLYEGNFAIAISSCGSGGHDLHKHFIEKIEEGDIKKIPQYIFSIPGDNVYWDDALVGWILFYHKLSKVNLSLRAKVQDALVEIYCGTGLKFSYHRWDEGAGKYKTFTPKPA